MKNPQSTYFLYGYYGAGNFGDDILLSAAIENIIARDSSARFLIRNHGPIDSLSAYGDRVTLTDIEKIHQSSGGDLSKFFKLLTAYWTWMGRASHLIVGGGTLIHDVPYLKSTFLLVCLAVIARLRGKKVFGIGLGTKIIKTALGKLIVRILIACFHRLCLRDEDSYARCLALAPSAKNIVLTSDLAYALDWNSASGNVADKHVIALTLVDYMFEDGRNVELPGVLSVTLTDYARNGHEVRLIAFQRGEKGDARVLQQVLNKMPYDLRETKCSLIMAEPTEAGMVAAYKGVSLMVGMRFHALVFAAMNGISFVGLAHEPKIDAIAKEFGMPALKLHNASPPALTTAMTKAMGQMIDRMQLSNDQNLARDNFAFIATVGQDFKDNHESP